MPSPQAIGVASGACENNVRDGLGAVFRLSAALCIQKADDDGGPPTSMHAGHPAGTDACVARDDSMGSV